MDYNHTIIIDDIYMYIFVYVYIYYLNIIYIYITHIRFIVVMTFDRCNSQLFQKNGAFFPDSTRVSAKMKSGPKRG